MKRYLILGSAIFAYLLPITALHTKSIETLLIHFNRELVEYDNTEKASGTIYYLSPHTITVIVKEPLQQWMIFGEKKLEIYYPAEQKAFRFTSSYPFQLSFFQAFIGVLNDDYGLRDIGYVLVHRSIHGDTITTVWKPPKALEKVLGDFILVYQKGKIIRAESKKPDGFVTSRSAFSKHIEFEENFLPLEITTIRCFESDSSIERIRFSDPEFNCDLPKDIIFFTIPESLDVEESEW